MNNDNGSNEKNEHEIPEDERPEDDEGGDDHELTVPLSPAVQAQFRAVSEALTGQMFPIQPILKDIAIVQQAPLRMAMRAINEAQSAKLLAGFQAIGRVYSAPLADAVNSVVLIQNRALAESFNSLGTFNLAPKISETLGKPFALQFPKIDFGGYRKVLESTAFFDAKKLLDSFDVTLPTLDPAVFEGTPTRAQIDLSEATGWIEADDVAEPVVGIQAALDEVVNAVKDLKDEVRRAGKLQVLLFVLGTLVAVLLTLAEARFEKPVIVRPVIVIEDNTPDLPAAPLTAHPASQSLSPSPEDPGSVHSKAAP